MTPPRSPTPRRIFVLGATGTKVDANGKIIAKNRINEEELARLPNGQWGVKRGSTGKVEPFVKFEVIQGGGVASRRR